MVCILYLHINIHVEIEMCAYIHTCVLAACKLPGAEFPCRLLRSWSFQEGRPAASSALGFLDEEMDPRIGSLCSEGWP